MNISLNDSELRYLRFIILNDIETLHIDDEQEEMPIALDILGKLQK